MKVLYAKIKDGTGEWRPTKVEKIMKMCEQKSKEKNRDGEHLFGFEEYYLDNLKFCVAKMQIALIGKKWISGRKNVGITFSH